MRFLVEGLDFKVAHTSGPSAAFLDIRFAQSSEASPSGLECDLSSIRNKKIRAAVQQAFQALAVDVPLSGYEVVKVGVDENGSEDAGVYSQMLHKVVSHLRNIR